MFDGRFTSKCNSVKVKQGSYLQGFCPLSKMLSTCTEYEKKIDGLLLDDITSRHADLN